eukprot:CAMPEP_0185480596 /NCGR_PEP_ID=MMETSP1366-20130426/6389_1 /TAXON_ID=38817 /ORGANISM="Gephyrocapsa oceanica, Strain RCC1303" /LENGTH=59 /DNA_ID=CAMNT_0028088165 /DNA_START=99 /DNA_END=276 /DNA_ORIENTATION=-
MINSLLTLLVMPSVACGDGSIAALQDHRLSRVAASASSHHGHRGTLQEATAPAAEAATE